MCMYVYTWRCLVSFMRYASTHLTLSKFPEAVSSVCDISSFLVYERPRLAARQKFAFWWSFWKFGRRNGKQSKKKILEFLCSRALSARVRYNIRGGISTNLISWLSTLLLNVFFLLKWKFCNQFSNKIIQQLVQNTHEVQYPSLSSQVSKGLTNALWRLWE